MRVKVLLLVTGLCLTVRDNMLVPKPDLLVLKELRAHKELKGLRVQKVLQEPKVPKELKVHKVLRER